MTYGRESATPKGLNEKTSPKTSAEKGRDAKETRLKNLGKKH